MGVVNSAFMDGSVRTIGENISIDVWPRYGTRTGSERISETPNRLDRRPNLQESSVSLKLSPGLILAALLGLLAVSPLRSEEPASKPAAKPVRSTSRERCCSTPQEEN